MTLRGRYLVFAWVGVFLATAGMMAWRDRRAFDTVENLKRIHDSLAVATARHAQLETAVANRQSIGAITATGEALGLVTPSDSEMVTLTIPSP